VNADDGDNEVERPRSRVVMYSTLAVAAVVAVFIAVLASARPTSAGNSSSPLVGKPAPPVAGPALLGGGHYSLAGYTGKWVLVNFSASWCVPCREETPQLQKFESEHSATGRAVVLAVAFDPSDVANLASFLAANRVTWPAVNDPSAEVAYGVSQIPQSYLVDPQGTVVAKFFGGVTAAQVDKVMAKVPSA
jgi:cytochrome c biogenesis protein CcmG/thiol:disulfide interchange protein DsbE